MHRTALWLIVTVFMQFNALSQWIQVSGVPGAELGSYPSISSPNKNVVVVAGGNTLLGHTVGAGKTVPGSSDQLTGD